MAQFQQILLIDDDHITNFLNKKLLQKLQISDEIVITLNGEEALRHLNTSQNIPELIFLDINMPMMNGFEFLEAYEKLLPPTNKKSQVFMLTTSTNLGDMKKIKNYNVSGYINKPLTVEKLEAVWKNNFTY